MDLFSTKRRRRVKLVFNPASGALGKSPVQLMDILGQLQAWRFLPEVFLVEPGCDIPAMVKDTLSQRISMFVVCGGDGTVSAVARELMGVSATLGIIPTGTQNNIAYSLGVPSEIPAAIAMLRMGRRAKVDMGVAHCGEQEIPFLELCSVGLISALMESGDEIQHGRLLRIGDFLVTLAAFSPSEFSLRLDGERKLTEKGHVALVTNMPFVCRHYCVGETGAFRDGLFDVLLFSDLSKLDLWGVALSGQSRHLGDDPRIKCFRAKNVELETLPPMPVMADGLSIGEGRVRFEIRRRSLAVMAAPRALREVKGGGTTGE